MAFVKALVVFALAVGVALANYQFGCDDKYQNVADRVLEKECKELKTLKTMDFKIYTECIQRKYKANIEDVVRNCSIIIAGEEMDFFRSLTYSCQPALMGIGRIGTCCVITKILSGSDVNESEDGENLMSCVDEALGKGKSS